MGEYADMAIDSMLAMDDYLLRFPDDDYGDDPNWNPFSGRWSRFTPRPKTCKRCGKKGLYWYEYPEGWRLQEGVDVDYGFGHERKFIKHECQLNFKSLIGRKRVDSDPDLEYNAYLDSIPSWTEEDFNDVSR